MGQKRGTLIRISSKMKPILLFGLFSVVFVHSFTFHSPLVSASSSHDQFHGAVRMSANSFEKPLQGVHEQEFPIRHKVINGADLKRRLKVGSAFLSIYSIDLVYYIFHKRALTVFPFPWTIVSAQFAVGYLVFLPIWAFGLRKRPKLSSAGLCALLPVSFAIVAHHIVSTLMVHFGTVSFSHIVKASEPFFAAAYAALVNSQVFAWPVYAALLPVVGGVGVACTQEPSFSMNALLCGMATNTFSTLRVALSKDLMKPKPLIKPALVPVVVTPRESDDFPRPGTDFRQRTKSPPPFLDDGPQTRGRSSRLVMHASGGAISVPDDRPDLSSLDSGNLNAVTVLMAAVLSLPLAFLVEGKRVVAGWGASVARVQAAGGIGAAAGVASLGQGLSGVGYWQASWMIARDIMIAGFLYCIYHEVSLAALKEVHMMTHTLGRTLKRAVMIFASALIFGTTITPLAAVGAITALSGVFAYSVAQDKCKAPKQSVKS